MDAIGGGSIGQKPGGGGGDKDGSLEVDGAESGAALPPLCVPSGHLQASSPCSDVPSLADLVGRAT